MWQVGDGREGCILPLLRRAIAYGLRVVQLSGYRGRADASDDPRPYRFESLAPRAQEEQAMQQSILRPRARPRDGSGVAAYGSPESPPVHGRRVAQPPRIPWQVGSGRQGSSRGIRPAHTHDISPDRPGEQLHVVECSTGGTAAMATIPTQSRASAGA